MKIEANVIYGVMENQEVDLLLKVNSLYFMDKVNREIWKNMLITFRDTNKCNPEDVKKTIYDSGYREQQKDAMFNRIKKITEELKIVPKHVEKLMYNHFCKNKHLELNKILADENLTLAIKNDAILKSQKELTENSLTGTLMPLQDKINEYLQDMHDGKTTQFNERSIKSLTQWEKDTFGKYIRPCPVVIAAAPGYNKCLGKGTKVIMSNGTLKKVEDITVGDKVMGIDSKPRTVMTTGTGREMMYFIKQNKGITYRVNENHILSLKRSKTKSQLRQPNIVNINLKEYMNKSNDFKNSFKGWKTNIDFKEKDTTIEPYFLGVWLGDGASKGIRIYNNDLEVEDYLRNYANRLNLSYNKKYDRTVYVHSITGVRNGYNLVKELRNYNLIRNKHIPHDFLCNSKEKRLELLAGVIDTDGHRTKHASQYIITQKREGLINDLKYLCDTLGFRTSIYKGHNKKYNKDYYYLSITGDIEKIPVKIEYKKARVRTTDNNWRHTGFEVIQDKVDDYYGFTLDGDHLFLLEDCTVTHNTTLAINLLNSFVSQGLMGMFFSWEDSIDVMRNKYLSIKRSVKYNDIADCNLDQDEKNRLYGLKKATNRVWVTDEPYNILEFRKEIDKQMAIRDYRYIFIDYIEMFKYNHREEPRELKKIMTEIVRICNKYLIPVFILSQINYDRTEDVEPRLRDLFGSSGLEKAARMVLMLGGVRSEPYRKLYIRKNSYGGLSTVNIQFDQTNGKISEV